MLAFLSRLFRRELAPAPTPAPAPVHVFPRDNRWGHAINWLRFPTDISGHLPRTHLHEGAVIAAEMQSNRIALFRVVSITWMWEPDNQFFATVEFLEYV